MGKKNRKRSHRQHDHGHPKKKQRKQGGYWADTCRESKPKEGGVAPMTVVISQSDLTDDHTHVAASTQDETSKLVENVEKVVAREEVITEAPETCEAKKEVASNQDTAAAAPEESKCPAVEESEVAEPPETAKKSDDYSHAFISVKRLSSASGPQKVYEKQNFRPLINGDCGDGIVNPHPKDQVADKYWAQRRRLFTRFDDGIELDKEGWFSVTPEAIANHIAQRVISSFSREGLVILDAFSGCGGNAIAFARRSEVSLVVCVDTDLSRLQMAAKNASIYNIEKKKLLFVHDNAIRILSLYSHGTLTPDAAAEKTTKVGDESKDDKAIDLYGYACDGPLPQQLDCIFLSPPWGGTEYEQIGKGHFSVKTHISVKDVDNKSVNGEELLGKTAKAARKCVYFLPRNLNGIAMGRSALQAGYTGSVELEKNVLNGKFKTGTAYLGFDNNEEATMPQQEQE